MRWALSSHDPLGWWERAQSVDNPDLVRRNDDEFKHHLDRWKYPKRWVNDGLSPQFHRDAAKSILLEPLQARLSTAPYLGGGTLCATDLAVMPFVRQDAAVDLVWFTAQDLPSVHSWLCRWLASTLFIACMQKLPASA